MEKVNPDICFFDREVVNNEDLTMLKDVHKLKPDTYIILAYFYYDADSVPENEINSIVDDVVLKPYQFDILIDKINPLKN